MKTTMKAQIFRAPFDLVLKDVAVPEIAENQVLVKVRACGVCGSDLAYYAGKSPLDTADGKGPLILGHEFSGEIAKVGKLAKDLDLFKEGDRVLVNPVQNCNACPQCRRKQVNLCKHTRTAGTSVNGAFAEYVAVNYTHVYKIPDAMSFETAALCEPLACASYGIKKLDVKLGDFVVIFGPGTIGLMQLKLIRALGAGKIAMVGILDYGLNKALEMGADYAINTLDKNSPYYTDDVAAKIAELSGGEMADKVIVPTAAKSALQGALEVSGKCANIVYFGLPGEDTILEVPLLNTLKSDKTINVSWLAPFTWDTAMKALRDGLVTAETFVTHKFKLEDLEEAIKFMMDNSKTEKIKAMITFD